MERRQRRASRIAHLRDAKLQYRQRSERAGRWGSTARGTHGVRADGRREKTRNGCWSPATEDGHSQQAGNSVRWRSRARPEQRYRGSHDSRARGGRRRARIARRVRVDHAGRHRSCHPADDRGRHPHPFPRRARISASRAPTRRRARRCSRTRCSRCCGSTSRS